jgi:hypothetical protein
MTDAEYERLKAKIAKCMEYWRSKAGFGWWTLDWRMEREGKEDEPNTAAETWEQWQYRQGTIAFYAPAMADMDDWKIEHVVVHELSHLLVGPIRDFSDDEHVQLTEAATENVTMALMYTADHCDGLALKAKPKKVKAKTAKAIAE